MRTKARFPDVPEKAGHYESFYLKLVQPGGGTGAWIRHTVHKRPKRPATCALWFVLFDSSATGPRATKRQFGAAELSAAPDCYIRIADASLTDGSAVGGVATDALEAKWDLSFADSHEPFHHLPRDFLYNAPVPRTKFLSPYPDSVFNGHLEVGGEWIAVEGWRGMIGHNWGAEHAERWVWIQGSGFEDRSPEDYFDMAVGRIKVAGRTTPWVGNAMLMLDGEAHRLGGFGHIPSTEVSEQPTGAGFELRGKGVKVTGSVQAPAKDFVAWVYADPVGPEHNTLNCSISDLELDVELDGGPAQRLAVNGAAAYEFGTRDTDHGIPVQPYPDG
ncbi:MAG TPA: hypothetical protein VGJ61_12140 [Solirubrobacterales bacterium]